MHAPPVEVASHDEVLAASKLKTEVMGDLVAKIVELVQELAVNEANALPQE